MNRGQLWQGISILVVLVVLAWLSGSVTAFGVAVLAWLFVPTFLAGTALAYIAARYAGQRAAAVTFWGTVPLTAALGATAAVLIGRLFGRDSTLDLFLGTAGIQAAIGLATGPFFARRAVYLRALRTGATDEQAREQSRWPG